MVETYVRCLNLSVSVGIALYEAARQLNYEQLHYQPELPEEAKGLFPAEDIYAWKLQSKNNLIEHAYSGKTIEFSTICSWQMSVWLSWRTTRDSVANQFQTDSLSRCPSHAHSKCVLGLPALWKNGVSFLWTCSQKVIRVWQDGASFWLFCVLVYWTISLLIACIASVECGLEGWWGHFTAIQTFVCVTQTQLTGQIVSNL